MKLPHLQSSQAPLTGYIEGYYGRLLSWPDRMRLLDKLRNLDMNAYFYAPKEDRRHRFNWREPYDCAWRTRFSAFCQTAAGNKIQVVAGIAPGLDFDFAQIDRGKDMLCLIDKAEKLREDGANHIALMLDDIDLDFHNRCGPFSSEGTAHGMLVNALSDALNCPIQVVPRVYANEIAAESPHYLAEFTAVLESEHRIYLCGSTIVARSLRMSDFLAHAPDRRNSVIVWDNRYANDYCPRRLYVGPWNGRDKISNIMLNPTGMIETDLLLLEIMKNCQENPLDVQSAWRSSLASHGIPDEFLAIANFFNEPVYTGDTLSTLQSAGTLCLDTQADSNIDKQLAAIETLLWQWKSPLSTEWYPYLMGLKHDLLIGNHRLADDRLFKTQNLPLAIHLCSVPCT